MYFMTDSGLGTAPHPAEIAALRKEGGVNF